MDLGAEIDYKATNGSTVLVAAALNGHDEIPNSLVKLGANVDVEFDGYGHFV